MQNQLETFTIIYCKGELTGWINVCWLQELPTRYTLDVMHIEGNICDNFFKHLFGENDTLNTRRNMEEVGIEHGCGYKERGQTL